MKICITGGSGFVGTKLAEALVDKCHSVLLLDIRAPRKVLSGTSFVQADLTKDPVPAEVLDCDGIVHLAGVNIFGRWTPAYKKLILESRVASARALIDACANASKKPSVFVSASAIGYYGDVGESELTEESPHGADFLSGVCIAWESVALRAESIGMRRVSIRTGIVLGPGGGMLAKLIPPFRWGLGGPMGSGKQWFSWIHLDDLIAVYVSALTDDRLSGPVNAVAPEPVRNRDFARALGEVFYRPAFIPLPRFALRLMLGELADAILASQRVVPKKLEAVGFKWQYPELPKALETIVKK